MTCQPRVVYLLILLLGIITHLCRCANYDHYSEHFLEHDKICHYLHKKFTHEMHFSLAAVVRQHHMFDHWSVNSDRHCRFVFKAGKDEGILAVINKMFFRRNETQCLDYVRFKRSDGFYTNKFCGEIDRSESTSQRVNLPVPDPRGPLAINKLMHLQNDNTYAEFDVSKRSSGAELETEIFISKEKVPDGRFLNLNIVYTPYKDCNKIDQNQYKPIGNNVCILRQYICDHIYNCPLDVCSDEINCSPTSITDVLPREDTATEVTVGAITTVILCFIIFVMCLWICKRSQKLCWSSDCAGPNVCSRPNSLPQDMDGSTSRAVPTAPMLEVAMPSSPVADKDLPPSYDSLFPEQSSPHESNPARS